MMLRVVYPISIYLSIYQDDPLGVDPWCWDLQRVNILG